MEAVGNIFFDISDANFTISSGPSCPAVTSFAPGAGSTGTSVVITGTGFTSVTAVKFSNNVSASFTIKERHRMIKGFLAAISLFTASTFAGAMVLVIFELRKMLGEKPLGLMIISLS